MPAIVREMFEKQFCETFHVKHAIAVNSGTSALVATLCSMSFRNGDEVITTPFTFAATISAIFIAGGTPVFVDVCKKDSLINPKLIEEKITSKTRAIVPVHLFGRCCDMQTIMDIAVRHKLVVIEDTAQSLGATWPSPVHPMQQTDGTGRDKRFNQSEHVFNTFPYLGTIGDAGCFSFYKTKTCSTFEGGMIAVPSWSMLNFDRIRCIASPTENKQQFLYLGYNFRMPEPCCLIGFERIKMHLRGIKAEVGSYAEADGYYPYLVYDLPFVKQRLAMHNICPVAEAIVRNKVKT